MASSPRAREALEAHEAQTDVLVVGGAGVDTIVRVEALPVPLADSHVVPPIRTVVGHTGTGVALGCHHLGLVTHFVDVIGDDAEGRMVTDRLATEGVRFGHVVHPSGTRRAVNLVDPQGRRMSFYDPRHPYDLEPDAALWREAVAAARHVHASIMPWTVAALDDAIGRGLTTSTDLHDWDGSSPHHRPGRRPRLPVGLTPARGRGRGRRRRAGLGPRKGRHRHGRRPWQPRHCA